MVVGDLPAQRLAQRGDLAPQPAFGQPCEHLWVALAGNQRGQHGPTRDTEHIGGDRVQLDPAILQRLLDALVLAGMGLDEPLAVAGQVPQLADRERWHEVPRSSPCSSSSASHSASRTSFCPLVFRSFPALSLIRGPRGHAGDV